MDYTLSVEQIKQSIQDKLNHTFVVSPENATTRNSTRPAP